LTTFYVFDTVWICLIMFALHDVPSSHCSLSPVHPIAIFSRLRPSSKPPFCAVTHS
jgi:hypothetical protein